jgi:hypothetical protein
MQLIASSVVFIAVEMCSNNSLSSSGAFCVAMGGAQRSPAQQMGRLQLSGVMSQYI